MLSPAVALPTGQTRSRRATVIAGPGVGPSVRLLPRQPENPRSARPVSPATLPVSHSTDSGVSHLPGPQSWTHAAVSSHESRVTSPSQTRPDGEPAWARSGPSVGITNLRYQNIASSRGSKNEQIPLFLPPLWPGGRRLCSGNIARAIYFEGMVVYSSATQDRDSVTILVG